MSQKASFPQSFKTQLFGYSLGAGATLAAIASASGSIVYSGPQNLTVSAGPGQSIDLNGGGNDFRFYLDTTTFPGSNGQYVVGTSPAVFAPHRLANGQSINSSVTGFSAPAHYLFLVNSGGGTPYGAFTADYGSGLTAARGYLPVRLGTSGGGFHYGWVDYKPSADGTTATIFGYAYETGNNVTIAAGAVPEPAESAFALGVLALGAAGLYRLRQRQAKNNQLPSN